MSNDEVVFQVDVKGLVLDKDELAGLMSFLRNKKFVHRDYKGAGKGFGGSEYDYSFVRCDEKAKVEIMPMNEAVWLYLNTFGKEEK